MHFLHPRLFFLIHEYNNGSLHTPFHPRFRAPRLCLRQPRADLGSSAPTSYATPQTLRKRDLAGCYRQVQAPTALRILCN